MNEKQRTTSTESHTLTAAKVLLFEAETKSGAVDPAQ